MKKGINTRFVVACCVYRAGRGAATTSPRRLSLRQGGAITFQHFNISVHHCADIAVAAIVIAIAIAIVVTHTHTHGWGEAWRMEPAQRREKWWWWWWWWWRRRRRSCPTQHDQS
ncbi:hypothetical protein E2C01_031416 [Portunus trituberculatus]|uniref:Uncharacterized protein n=1 Tax=Portunus trituberculatus TaxID=210409 RepID=A0A5B7ETD6_PORTR|nr:hypothetical protein [Portunus trituberculatus]